VVLCAGGGAGVVATAALYALNTPFRAGPVWESQGVFGHVRSKAIGADAGVAEISLETMLVCDSHVCEGRTCWIAVIGVGGHVSVRFLKADQRAGSLLITAPLVLYDVSSCFRFL
jgi:hypothetical protein